MLINNEEKLLKKTLKKINIDEFLENKNICITLPVLKNLINFMKKEEESENARGKSENKEEGLLTNHLKAKDDDDDYDIKKAAEKELNLEKLSSFLEKKRERSIKEEKQNKKMKKVYLRVSRKSKRMKMLTMILR